VGSSAAQERTERPSVVLVKDSWAVNLHLVAHRASAHARTVEDWWGSSLETALAAVALARHPSVYREEAKEALERMLRWRRDEGPRRTSEDAAALALTARAAADLQRSHRDLVEGAASAVEDLARRDRALVPLLHLALCVWALDRLIPDREQRPWPSLKSRFDVSRAPGIDQAIRRYGIALSSQPFDANALVQDLLAEVRSSPGPSESCLLLWILTIANERLVESLPATDNALGLLLRYRAELGERLAGEIDDSTFIEPSFADVTDGQREHKAVTYLSTFEAVILDVALASDNEAEPWVTFSEAKSLFGEREAQAARKLQRTRQDLQRRMALLLLALGLTTGSTAWLAATRLGGEETMAVSVGLAVAAAIGAFSAVVWHRANPSNPLSESLGLFSILLSLLMAINAVNQGVRRPFLPDAFGFVAGALLAAAATALWQLAKWALLRDRK
jgi:hypothetical protein